MNNERNDIDRRIKKETNKTSPKKKKNVTAVH